MLPYLFIFLKIHKSTHKIKKNSYKLCGMSNDYKIKFMQDLVCHKGVK